MGNSCHGMQGELISTVTTCTRTLGGLSQEHELRALEVVVARLCERFPLMPRSDIEVIVHEEYGKLSAGQIRDYVAVLVEQAARSRLTQANA